MTPYRTAPLTPSAPSKARPASWWRLLRAWLRGTFARIAKRRERIAIGIILFGPGWQARRGEGCFPIPALPLPMFGFRLPIFPPDEDP